MRLRRTRPRGAPHQDWPESAHREAAAAVARYQEIAAERRAQDLVDQERERAVENELAKLNHRREVLLNEERLITLRREVDELEERARQRGETP